MNAWQTKYNTQHGARSTHSQPMMQLQACMSIIIYSNYTFSINSYFVYKKFYLLFLMLLWHYKLNLCQLQTKSK